MWQYQEDFIERNLSPTPIDDESPNPNLFVRDGIMKRQTIKNNLKIQQTKVMGRSLGNSQLQRSKVMKSATDDTDDEDEQMIQVKAFDVETNDILSQVSSDDTFIDTRQFPTIRKDKQPAQSYVSPMLQNTSAGGSQSMTHSPVYQKFKQHHNHELSVIYSHLQGPINPQFQQHIREHKQQSKRSQIDKAKAEKEQKRHKLESNAGAYQQGMRSRVNKYGKWWLQPDDFDYQFRKEKQAVTEREKEGIVMGRVVKASQEIALAKHQNNIDRRLVDSLEKVFDKDISIQAP